MIRHFKKGDFVRHRKSGRTGQVYAVSDKGRGYMLIDWDDKGVGEKCLLSVDLWTWWPPASFVIDARPRK